MTIPVTLLPSGGYGYSFPSVNVSPMTFIQITKYLENLPKEDNLEKYLYEITDLLNEDRQIENCYLMDVDFLIFYKKLITVSGDNVFKMSTNCPICGKRLTKSISIDHDIHFKQIDKEVMEGAQIELNGHQYETVVPTVKDFFKIFERYLKYRTVTDLEMIKTISLIKESDLYGNQVQNDVLNATHNDITLLLALKELYFNRVEDIIFHCPDCDKDKKVEERRSIAVSAQSLTVDFFRELCINSPINGQKIIFKQIHES